MALLERVLMEFYLTKMGINTPSVPIGEIKIWNWLSWFIYICKNLNHYILINESKVMGRFSLWEFVGWFESLCTLRQTLGAQIFKGLKNGFLFIQMLISCKFTKWELLEFFHIFSNQNVLLNYMVTCIEKCFFF